MSIIIPRITKGM